MSLSHFMTKQYLISFLLLLISPAMAQNPQGVKGVFRNMTSAPVMVYWVDEDGSNKVYLEDPVPAYGQQEFRSHPGGTWRAYHGQKFIKEYVATNKAGQVFLISLAPLNTPTLPKPPGATLGLPTPPPKTPTLKLGTERFYTGNWKRSECIAKLIWENRSGASVVKGMICNSHYISPVTGSYDANTRILTLKFDDSTDPSEDFQLIEGRLDGQVTWYDDEGLDFVEISPGEVHVETFENIAGFMIGADENKVVAAADAANLGRPIRGLDEMSDATGEYYQTWDYPNAGISLLMASEKVRGWKSVATITMKVPSRFKTLQGVGIGTPTTQAKKAYSAYFVEAGESQGLSDDQHLVGSIYGGLILSFKNGAVSEVFLGPAAE